jgi:hypothetical protein
VTFELEFATGASGYRYPAGRLVTKPGKRVWTTTIPANGMIRAQFLTIENEAFAAN